MPVSGCHTSPLFILIKSRSRMHIIAHFLPLAATLHLDSDGILNDVKCDYYNLTAPNTTYHDVPELLSAVLSCMVECVGLVA